MLAESEDEEEDDDAEEDDRLFRLLRRFRLLV
jgi:hypothetical protein